MNRKKTVFIAFALIELTISLAWLVYTPGLEPLSVFVGSLATVVTVWLAFLREPSSNENSEFRRRQAMLRLVHDFWIKGVLEGILYSDARIGLTMLENIDAVDTPTWTTNRQFNRREGRVFSSSTNVTDVFNKIGNVVLVLGESGSGKTTVLLDLANEALTRANDNQSEPIPVIFKLSSWTDKYDTLEDWCIEELCKKYYIPRHLAETWMVDDALFLILDGLDEVGSMHRSDCLNAINIYRMNHGLVPIAVSCQTTDYLDLSSKLLANGALEIQSLSMEEIDAYLEEARIEQNIKDLLRLDPALLDGISSPLMLSICIVAYKEVDYDILKQLNNVEKRRGYLFDIFIEEMTNQIKTSTRKKQKFHKWLKWIAKQMEENHESLFSLEEINRLKEVESKKRGEKLSFAILFLFGMISGVTIGFYLFRANGLALGFLIGFFWTAWIQHTQTMRVERLSWSSNLQWESLLRGLAQSTWRTTKSLIWPTSMVLLMNDLFVWLRLFLLEGVHPTGIEVVALIVLIVIVGPLVGLFLGIIFGPINGIIHILRQNMSGDLVNRKTRPNQGVWLSGLSFVKVWFMYWFASFLMASLIRGIFFVAGDPVSFTWGDAIKRDWFIVALVLLPLISIGLGLINGGKYFLEHWAVRTSLFFSGKIPFRLEAFLDQMRHVNFLRRVGGGYVFVHPLLQTHFSNLNNNKPVQSSM